MRELFKLSLILAIICCGAALSLAYVYNLTKEPIAEQKRLKKKRAIQAVFPNLQQTSAPESINVPIGSNNKGEEQFRPHYILKIDESVSGVAFEVETPGYGGPIAIMAGVDNQLSVTGIKIISHSETPGLGANITSDDFCRQFSGKDLTDLHWKLKQNGGTVDQISGATISTRAVTKAVHTGLTFYAENKEKILKISSQ